MTTTDERADAPPGGGGPRGPGTEPSLAAAVRAVSGVTLLSRIGGLARDVILARLFGVTALNSAFLAAFAIPNMFRRLFGEGALAAAFLPEYTDATGKNPREAGELASLTIAALGVVTSAITVAAEVVLLVLLLTLPADPARALSLKLIMVMLPFMPLICAVAILAAMLQVHGRFGPAATGPLVLNGFIIATGAFYLLTGREAGEGVAYVLGVATVLSGATQGVWFAWLLRGKVRWTLAWGAARERARRMLRRFGPVVIGLGTLQAAALIDTLIAMWPIWVGPTVAGVAYPLDEGSNTVLTLTQRLYQFPLGVFGIAVATAVFPMLARTSGDGERFAATLRRGLRLSLFIGLPASVGLALVRADAVAVLYSGGERGFSADDLMRASAVLLGYATGVWAFGLNHVLTRAFYARGDTTTPMRVSLLCVGINLALNLALIWPLAEAGLSWATSIAAAVQCVVLGRLCRTRLGVAALDAPTVMGGVRMIAAALAMAAVVGMVVLLAPTPGGWLGHAVRLVIAAGVGAGAYAALARLGRLPELQWLLARGK